MRPQVDDVAATERNPGIDGGRATFVWHGAAPSLEQAGIPIGGLFSGANELKTAEQASLFGGTADSPADACYHLACDTTANVDPVLLEQLARAAAWVTGALASGEVSLTP